MTNIDSWIEIINKTYAAMRIPMVLINNDRQPIHGCPITESPFWQDSFLQSELQLFHRQALPNHMPYMRTIFYDVMIAIIRLSPDYYVIIGPTSPEPCNLQDLFKQYGYQYSREILLSFYRNIERASHSDNVRFASVLSILIELFFQEKINFSDILRQNYITEAQKLTPKSKNNLQNLAHEIYNFEGQLEQAIKQGSTALLDSVWSVPLPMYNHISATRDEYMLFVSNSLLTLMRSASIRGGLAPDDAFALYDAYLRLTLNQQTSTNIYTLFVQASYDYCLAVNHQKSETHLPSLYYECKEYIVQHISNKITQKELATSCGVSIRTISRIFHDYFKMSLSDYVNQEKIRHAAFLIDSTKLTLSEISDQLGYVSQSYFSRNFYKILGCTPSEYIKHGSNLFPPITPQK